ncbi:MAG: hypothetical protein QE487_02935 [Fluviicola sp.]|nr:hypothetical protein [Fluviicola sp.]
MNITYKHVLILSASLAIVALFVPIVWLEVSRGGYKMYGPTVPHVYIYGGAITGKDTSFEGIAFAIQFQRIFILLFIMLGLISFNIKRISSIFRLLFVQLFLLLLFPVWMALYVNGVICNSDGAGLTEHYHIGMLIYLMLVILNIATIVQVYRVREIA